MPLSVEEFLQELTKSGLMSEADIQALRDGAPDGGELAEEFVGGLVKSGRLTGFQAKALLGSA